MNCRDDANIDKTKIIILDESPLMKKLVYDVFSDDVGIDIVGIFKDYRSVKKFLSNLEYMVDCVIVNLKYIRDDVLNILLNLKCYGFNILFVTNIGSEKISSIEEILDFKNIKFIDYLGKLTLSEISRIKDSIIREVYAIKDNRIKQNFLNSEKALVIASSTGGPKILEHIFSKFKMNLDIPIFIVQHMPDGCTKQFADRLSKICDFEFREGRDGELIKPNVIYIAPSGYHMEIHSSKRISLNKNDFVNNVRPSADILFCSASRAYREGLLGVVLTGMGKDAAYGVECIKKRGGITMAQNENSCEVFGMPKAAIETGDIDKVLSVNDIVVEILKHSGKI